MDMRILETGELGCANPNDPVRDLNILDVQESTSALGNDYRNFRVEGIPNYIGLLEHTFTSLGWDPTKFRGYRTRIDYPIFSSQIQHCFKLPVLADDDSA